MLWNPGEHSLNNLPSTSFNLMFPLSSAVNPSMCIIKSSPSLYGMKTSISHGRLLNVFLNGMGGTSVTGSTYLNNSLSEMS